MTLKNIVIDVDEEKFYYGNTTEQNIVNALVIVNELLAHANALVQNNDVVSAAVLINKVWVWLGQTAATITTAGEAYTEISKIYTQLEGTGTIDLPEVCPFEI